MSDRPNAEKDTPVCWRSVRITHGEDGEPIARATLSAAPGYFDEMPDAPIPPEGGHDA